MPRPLLILFLASLPLSGCTCHSTGSTEVGVLTRKLAFAGLLGKAGVQPEVYAPGATYFFPAFITDWNTFDVSLQNLSMVRDVKKGDRTHEDDLFFKTIDGEEDLSFASGAFELRMEGPDGFISLSELCGDVHDKCGADVGIGDGIEDFERAVGLASDWQLFEPGEEAALVAEL